MDLRVVRGAGRYEKGLARWSADRAVDRIRERFGWDAIGYGSAVHGLSRSVPDDFRMLAEKGGGSPGL